MERNTLTILDIQEAKGSVHDFTLYKDSIGKSMSNSIAIDADLGYLEITEYHPNSFVPIKSSKNHQLTKREQGYNKRLAKRRVVINAKIKTLWHIHTGGPWL